MNIDSTVHLFKILGDSTRMKIILSLQNTEKRGIDIIKAVGVTQSNLSHQMQNLLDARIVISRKEGKCVYYSISPDFHNTLIEITRNISAPKPKVCHSAQNPIRGRL